MLSWIEIIGYIGLCAYVFAYIFSQPRSTVSMLLAGDSLYAVHLLAMGAIGAGLIYAFTTLRCISTLTLKRKKWLTVFIVAFVVCMWGISLWKWQGIQDLLPAIGITISSIGMLYRNSFWQFRLCMFTSHILWLGYFSFLGSVPAVAYVSLALSMNGGTMLYRAVQDSALTLNPALKTVSI